MALSELKGLFKQRKYPFLLSLFLLLIFVTFLLIHNSQSSSFLLPSEALLKSQEISSKNNGDSHNWKLCQGPGMADYIPCLDNWKDMKKFSKLERKERHCPKPTYGCLVPLPNGYKTPVPWPKSRDMIWYDNVPYPKLVEYKKEQNWVVKSGEYLIFPGGGTQFKLGVNHYIESIEKGQEMVYRVR